MEGTFLFYFTDESTIAAPKCDLRINLTKNPHDIVDIVKLNEPITIKEINSWLNQYQKLLKEIGIGAKTALPIPDSINSTVCKTRFHNDNTIDTIRYAMHIYF